jgi:1,2-diacylglycerol 3-beta-glucosyltransferase
MQENSWPENNSYSEFEPLGSLLNDSGLADALLGESLLIDRSQLPESKLLPTDLSRGRQGRRRKAAAVLVVIWGGTVALHLFSYSFLLVFGMTTLMGVHAFKVLRGRSLPIPEPLAADTPETDCPLVSLLVAAKNEEAVISRLVKALCELDYPASRYELWIIDDHSTDRTPVILEQLQQQYQQLRVLRREADATGGKSGALNQVLPLTRGQIIGVFDADAQVPADLLRRVLPLFRATQVGAVQVRKSIANAKTNFWTQGQQAEMALDAFFLQQQRTAIGGIGELRGNGQFVRRAALERCGNWNEETITDDLDLTLRLHLDRWDIAFMMHPAVSEEGVTQAIALWHQRSRWAEGGYQRYLDYWQPILRNRMGTRKTFDLVMFLITQYLLPTAAVPDFLMAIARNRPPLFLPMTSLTLVLSLWSMTVGLNRIRKAENLPPMPFTILMQALRGTLYMVHWLPVMATTTARMSIRPKRLKWVKTIHQGSEDTLSTAHGTH